MKTFVTVLALSLLTAVAIGEDKSPSVTWMNDLEQAQKLAAKQGSPILLQFSGSDWCGWCMKLEKEVFSQAAFAEYAKTALILVKADYPRRTKLDKAVAERNEKLLEKYGVEGFPTVLLIDADGKVLARTGYRPGGAEAYVEYLKSVAPKVNTQPAQTTEK